MWCDAPHPALAIIEAHESAGRNVMNYINDATHTAGGFWQITNTTWRGSAPLAGVNLRQYPTAISAPCPIQRAVASALFAKEGVGPWAAFSRGLAVQLGYSGPIYDADGLPAFYGRASREHRNGSDDQVWE